MYLKEEREEEHVQISKQKNKKKVTITWKVCSFLNCLEEHRNQEKGKVGTVVDDYK